MPAKRFEMNTTPYMQQIPHPSSYLAVSREKMFHVLNYSPLMGPSGTTVTIDTLFVHRNSRDVHIRIVIGCKPIPTAIENIGGDKWRCTGSAPEFVAQKYPLTHTVNISIEAVVSRNVVVDSVAFGYFTYREYGLYPSIPLHPDVLGGFRDESSYLHLTRLPTPHSASLHQVAQSRTPPAPVEGPPVEDQASDPTPASRRTLRRYDNKTDGDHDPVLLELDGDLRGLGRNLTEEELARRRRLVRFIREEDGSTIRLSFYPIHEDDYKEEFFVISCIYREDSHDTWFTSVDIMRLIEFVSQEECNHEKGRLRRNLEFLRPTTVSRMVRPHLFTMVMEFPTPKPRTIEKSIKLFKWSSLVVGLHKVMEKYAWFEGEQQTNSPPAKPNEDVPMCEQGAQSPISTPKASVTEPHDTPHRPTSDPPFASRDGANVPGSSTQLEVPATHVNPSWLHPQNVFIGSTAPAPNPFVCDNMPAASIRRAHMTPDAEVGHNSQTPTHYESFHHFDSLEFQTLHVTHAGMVSPFI